MRSIGLAVALALWGTGAAALSCVPMSVEWLYSNAAKATEAYVPVVGRLSDVSLAPKPGGTVAEPVGEIGRALFKGHYVDSKGALKPWQTPVVAETFCTGSWCGGVPEGARFLGFLRVEGDAYHFEGFACPGILFDPSQDDVARLQSCLKGADCAPDF